MLTTVRGHSRDLFLDTIDCLWLKINLHRFRSWICPVFKRSGERESLLSWAYWKELFAVLESSLLNAMGFLAWDDNVQNFSHDYSLVWLSDLITARKRRTWYVEKKWWRNQINGAGQDERRRNAFKWRNWMWTGMQYNSILSFVFLLSLSSSLPPSP
jgi:hypothetical protein